MNEVRIVELSFVLLSGSVIAIYFPPILWRWLRWYHYGRIFCLALCVAVFIWPCHLIVSFKNINEIGFFEIWLTSIATTLIAMYSPRVWWKYSSRIAGGLMDDISYSIKIFVVGPVVTFISIIAVLLTIHAVFIISVLLIKLMGRLLA